LNRAAEFDFFSLRELLTSEAGRAVRLTVMREDRRVEFTVFLDAD
jgi:hypothetical protein